MDQSITLRKTHPDDILVWPDGMTCEGREAEEYIQWRGDDYRRVYVDTPEWLELVNAQS